MTTNMDQTRPEYKPDYAACSVSMQRQHAASACSVSMQRQHAASACSRCRLFDTISFQRATTK
jgi:hypothetical protein